MKLRQPTQKMGHGANSRQICGGCAYLEDGGYANAIPLGAKGIFLCGKDSRLPHGEGKDMAHRDYYFTSESVTEGHPDKMCDQISDAILDAIISKESALEKAGYVAPNGIKASAEEVRCACETFVTTGTVIVAGEIRTQAYVDVQQIVRDTVRRIGYDDASYGFDATTCGVLNLIHEQSPDIAQGVDESYDAQAGEAKDALDLVGAGDQGMMFGYASDETDVLMPMPIYLAQRLAERLSRVRKDGTLHYLRPDGKTQVTVRYEDDKPVEVNAIVISAQHDPAIHTMDIIRRDMINYVIQPVLDEVGITWRDAKVYVNPTGRFVVGGPMGDTGLTGRKIIVDTYGGMGRHGGGAFSGKDCTKVDRSAAYAARWVAKNIVAAGLAHKCEVELAYAIGVSHPLSIMVDSFGTSEFDDDALAKVVEQVFDLRPAAIIRDLDLRRPIYEKTATYGHFGRNDPDFTWEKTDKVEALKDAVAKLA
jgi:S-adenosylmethionine synthetase